MSHPQVGLVVFSSRACQDQPCRVLDIPENPLSHSMSHFLVQITRKYVCMYVCMCVCVDACMHVFIRRPVGNYSLESSTGEATGGDASAAENPGTRQYLFIVQ